LRLLGTVDHALLHHGALLYEALEETALLAKKILEDEPLLSHQVLLKNFADEGGLCLGRSHATLQQGRAFIGRFFHCLTVKEGQVLRDCVDLVLGQIAIVYLLKELVSRQVKILNRFYGEFFVQSQRKDGNVVFQLDLFELKATSLGRANFSALLVQRRSILANFTLYVSLMALILNLLYRLRGL